MFLAYTNKKILNSFKLGKVPIIRNIFLAFILTSTGYYPLKHFAYPLVGLPKM
jgi:hypothetical protein